VAWRSPTPSGKALEDTNAKLKKLLVELMLDNAMLKDVAPKNGDARRQA
jgi:putative transposase